MVSGGICAQCGVSRQLGDRFCSACGAKAPYSPPTPRQFPRAPWNRDDSPTTGAARTTARVGPAEIINIEADPQGKRGWRTSRPPEDDGESRDRRFVMGLVFGVIAVVIGLSLLSSRVGDSGESASNEAAAAGERESSPDPTPRPTATARPATSTPVPTPNVRDVLSPSAPVVSATAHDAAEDDAAAEQDDLTEQALVDADLPAGWLVNYEVSRGPAGPEMDMRVYDTATGEFFTLPPSELRDGIEIQVPGAINSYGRLSRMDQVTFILRPWIGTDDFFITMQEDQGILRAFEDPDHGLLVLLSPNVFAGSGRVEPREGAWEVVKVATGERQLFDPWPGVYEQLIQGFWGGSVGSMSAINPRVTVNGIIYSWQWEGGWLATGSGELVVAMKNSDLVAVCTSPTECRRELRTADGELLVRDIDGPNPDPLVSTAVSVGGLSANGQNLLVYLWPRDPFSGLEQPTWWLFDPAQQTGRIALEDTSWESRVELVWIEDQLLIAAQGQPAEIWDVETDSRVTLEGVESGVLTETSVAWFPEFADLRDFR